MIHTIVSLNDVFAESTPKLILQRHTNGYTEYIDNNGQRMLCRYFSTKPSDYLKMI